MNWQIHMNERGIRPPNTLLNEPVETEGTSMALPHDKQTISVILDDEVVEVLDRIAEEVGISRSKLIANCVDVTLQDFALFQSFGLPPRRLKKVVDAVDKLGLSWVFEKSRPIKDIGKKKEGHVKHATV